MLERRLAFSAVSLAAGLLTACFPDYFPRRQLRNIVPEQVVGTWQLRPTRVSQRFLAYPVPADTKSTAEFSSDGSCSLNNLIDNGDLFSGKATWNLTTEEDRDASHVSVLEIHLPNSAGGHEHIFRFYFTHVHEKLIFWQYIGDPDSREYVEYERI
jgi:hypothetical protein